VVCVSGTESERDKVLLKLLMMDLVRVEVADGTVDVQDRLPVLERNNEIENVKVVVDETDGDLALGLRVILPL